MIDSHAHVAFDSFDEDREAVVRRAREAGLSGWIEVGTDIRQSKKAIRVAEQYSDAWATVGVHPSDIDSLNEAAWSELETLFSHERVKAVGEVGLDFYRGGSLDAQLVVLQRFLSLAIQYALPVIFHVRNGEAIDAHGKLISLLRSYTDDQRPAGVIHTYSGTYAQAQQYLALGMHLSFSGVVTFKNGQGIAEVARTIPLDRLLIETDCPFLAPDPYRGKRNEPAYIALVADKVATLRGVEPEMVRRVTQENTERLFKLI